MPSVSKAQQRLMQMAEHDPAAVSAKNRGVLKMTHQQLHDFAVGSEAGKPVHVPHPARNLGPHLKPPSDGEIVTSHHRGAKKPK